MNAKIIPYLLEFPIEKKIVFYNTYVPEFISTFKNYLSDLQLCLDYNYFKNLDLEQKVNNIIEFYTSLGNNNFKIDKVQLSNNKVEKSGSKTAIGQEFMLYWLNKFSTLSQSIQDEINSNLKTAIKFDEFSTSIGILTYIRNELTNNVLPYWDIGSNYFPPCPPMGAGVYRKITDGNMYTLAYANYKNNIMFKNNMRCMISDEAIEKDKILVKEKSGLNTTPHQEDLITDTKSYFKHLDMLSTLNGELSRMLDCFYTLINNLRYSSPYVGKNPIENQTFVTLDNEGKNARKDLYQNIIPSEQEE